MYTGASGMKIGELFVVIYAIFLEGITAATGCLKYDYLKYARGQCRALG